MQNDELLPVTAEDYDPEFVEAWAEQEDAGFIYSESNIAKVYLGWKLARHRIESTRSAGGEGEVLARFGHHPDPAIDFCHEVDQLESIVTDKELGLRADEKVPTDRIARAMLFRVGGDAGCVAAKDNLRKIERRAARLTAPSGDLVPGLERAAQWHDARCKGPDVFEQELHEVSAKALRHLAANPEATDMQALDAGQSGEGRTAGEGWIAHHGGNCPVDPAATVEIKLRDGSVTTMTAKAVNWRYGTYIFEAHCTMPAFCEVVAYRLAALSAPQGEVERLARNVRGWLEWYRLTQDGDDCDYLNGNAWADAEALASTSMGLLAALAQPKGGDHG